MMGKNKLRDLRGELRAAEDAVDDALNELSKAEEEVFRIENEITALSGQAINLDCYLPTEALLNGFHLIDVREERVWRGEKKRRICHSLVILEAPDGDIAREWESVPSLVDIFEVFS